jgi:choline dehydrogenase
MQGPFAFRGFWPRNQTNKNLFADPGDRYGISMVKIHPQNNTGCIKLESANPQEQPDINCNHFGAGNETDMAHMGAMKDTVAWARQIYNATNSRTGPVNVMEPPCPNGPDANTNCGQADEDWITAKTFGHHPTSTCAIGCGAIGTMAVVDTRLRVRGGCRIASCSANTFPRTPGAFPVVPTFMISEKASDTILEDAKNETGC